MSQPDYALGQGCILGSTREARLRDPTLPPLGEPRIGSRATVGNYVIVGEGSAVGERSVLEDFTRIGYAVSIGNDCRVMYRAWICDRVTIEANCRIAGFLCDRATIHEGATSMGSLVHAYTDPQAPWWGPDEPSPVICEGAVVGMGALVVGGVEIGRGSYVAAGATVTRDVPAGCVVTGINIVVDRSEWQGNVRLSHRD